MQKLVWQNSNGDEINLTSGNYGITNWEGFANTSLNIQSQQVPFQDGGVFLDALMEQRELSVTLAMYDGGNLETRYRMRRELVHALNPKLGEGYLIYTNDFISKRIKCVAQIPLFETHNSNDSGTPKASLAWTACDPYWEDLEETEVHLSDGLMVNIENNGDVDVGVKLKLWNDRRDSVINYVQNITQSKKIQYSEKIPKSVYEDVFLHIDTRVGKKSVYFKNVIDINKMNLFNSDIQGVKFSETYQCFFGIQNNNNEYILKKSIDGINWDVVLTTTYPTFCIYNNVLLLYKIEGGQLILKIGVDFTTWKEVTTDVSFGSDDVLRNVLLSTNDNAYRITLKINELEIRNSFFQENNLENYDGHFLVINPPTGTSYSSLSIVFHEGLNKLFAIYNSDCYYVNYNSLTKITTTGHMIYPIHNKGVYLKETNQIYVFGGTMYGYIDYSEDGIHWQQAEYEFGGYISTILYHKNKFMITGSTSTDGYPMLYLTSDLSVGSEAIEKITFINKQQSYPIDNMLFNINNDTFYLDIQFGNYNRAILKEDFQEINEIQNLSKDSDMNLKLLVGSNRIICSNNLIVSLAYRQKYIGV